MSECYIQNTTVANGAAGVRQLLGARFALGKVIRLGVYILAVCAIIPGRTGKWCYTYIHAADRLASRSGLTGGGE